jgi:hypothetical protein
MPFFIGRILELPLTTTQDYSLFHILNDYSTDLWRQQLQSIADRHGLATFIVHPDYIIESRARRTYGLLLEHLARARDERRTWITLPREVDRWWRNRRQMTLVHDGARWRIEGPDSDRARLAYATLADDSLTLEIVDPEPASRYDPSANGGGPSPGSPRSSAHVRTTPDLPARVARDVERMRRRVPPAEGTLPRGVPGTRGQCQSIRQRRTEAPE